uniref:Mannose receptor, C type 1b n=1 Tax=Takifugu rubripes TaxID=31033 RepID=A0A674P6A3_TAKRU
MRTDWKCRRVLAMPLICSSLHHFADSPFSLTSKATGLCILKKSNRCLDVRWTTGDRLFATITRKCLGAQGKSLGSEVSFYDCDDKSELQKWECKNETLLALKGQQLYIEVKPDEALSLSRTVGPNNHLTVTGMTRGACSRTYREGNAFGKPCAFPFFYKDRWFGECTTYDSSTKRAWCAVGTRFENEQWGYCPTTSTDKWIKNLVTGANYQLNTQSVLTWSQAETSCRQQGASLLSVSDPHQQAFVSGKQKLWIGLVLDPEHGWRWSDLKPFRYLRWSPGNPLPNPGHNCAFLDTAGQHTWQSASCTKKLGYICYKDGAPPAPSEIEQGFCSNPWIPYNGHCFYLNRSPQTWYNAQKECRKEGGDLVSVQNVEEQSFIISQLGFASTDELWIGFNDIKIEGLFDWSDHSSVSFTSWTFGKPDVSTDAEDCVLITGENGNWVDRLCERKHGFICMKQSTTESTGDEVEVNIGCKLGWKRHGSYCYLIGTAMKTFDEAKSDCETSGSYLADVSNGVDNAFLVSLVGLRPEKHFWLGLSNQKNIDEFVWTQGGSVKYTHWNAGMPGYEQGCVAMRTGPLAGLWDLLPCTNTSKYICKHLAEGAVLTAPPPTQMPLKCEQGWNRIGTRNYCVKFFTGPRSNEKTWFEARDYCRAIGGDLLIFCGFSSRLPWHCSGTFPYYQNTFYVNFLHWQEGEPNNHNNDESCTEFRMHNSWEESGSWNDVNCESYNDWLCQIRAGKVGMKYFNITSDGWLEWRGNQYYLNRNPMYMEKARHLCQQKHGDLVSISSKEENNFLWKQIARSYGSYYIGLSVDIDGRFWWMDGSSLGLQKWDENQPNPDTIDANCVTMNYYMGYWRTCNCGQEHEFICKRSGSTPANTTAAPTVPPKGGSFLTTKMAELSATNLWIGLNSLNQDGFYWTDGKPRQYTNWGYSEDCVVMNSNAGQSIGKWLIKSCNETYGFVCTRKVDPNIPSQPDTYVPKIYVSVGNDSIKVVTTNLTWDDAKKNCEADKASLASLRNEWSQAYIELLVLNLKAPVWIGLNKKQTGGYFKYIDNWHLKFASWAEDEPSSDKPCVYLDVDGQWRTAFCNQTMNSVCMQTTEVPPTESSVFPGVCPEDTKEEYHQSYSWLPFKGYCYLFVTDEIEWANAAGSCVRHGGVLASIEDPAEQAFIQNSLDVFHGSHSSFWIGLYKTDMIVVVFSILNSACHRFRLNTWYVFLSSTMINIVHNLLKTISLNYPCCMFAVSSTEFRTGRDSQGRGHTSLIVVLIIVAVCSLAAGAFIIYKKSPRLIPTFDNPLYFESDRTQPDVVDTNRLIENAEVENTEPIITL